MSTRHASRYALWAASRANATRISPTVVPLVLSTADRYLPTSARPFAVGLRDAHATTSRALTAVEDNPNQKNLPPLALRALRKTLLMYGSII